MKKSPGVDTPTSKGRLNRPKGEANALANSDQRRGVVSGVLDPDPVIEKMLAAVAAKAVELGVELEGRLWVKPQRGGGCEVHAGRPKIGVLRREQVIQCDVAELFLLHRSVLIDVVAPRPDKTPWAEWSAPIRGAQWALGRLMDAAVDCIRLASREGKTFAPETLAYQTMSCEEEQDKLRAEAAKKFDRTKAEMWRARAEFSISGATMSCASRRVCVQYKRWTEGEIGYPSWSGPGGGVYVRADSFHLTDGAYTTKEGEIRPTFVCHMKILGGRGATHECAVRPNGDSARAIVRRIIDGAYRHGDATLLWNERKSRWQLQLAYTMPRVAPKAIDSRTVYLSVRRSVDDMLFAMDSRGSSTFEGVALRGLGLKIIAVRRQYGARKGEAHAALNAQGKNARGHGKKRFFRLATRLRDKEARAIDSLLKQLASHIRRAAERCGAGTVLIEDYTVPWKPQSGDPRFIKLLTRMPWAQAEGALRFELEEHGLRLKKVTRVEDGRCPSCGAETVRLLDNKYIVCDAEGCGLFAPRLFVESWQMFKAVGVEVDPALVRTASYVARAIRKRRLKEEDVEKLSAQLVATGDYDGRIDNGLGPDSVQLNGSAEE